MFFYETLNAAARGLSGPVEGGTASAVADRRTTGAARARFDDEPVLPADDAKRRTTAGRTTR